MAGGLGGALTEGAAEILGRPLEEGEQGQFERYLGLLMGWGRTVRLVGRLDRAWIERELLLDSLLFLRVLPGGPQRVMDLGSGAGIPGVPLRIVRRDLAMILVEARRRRASFLRTVVREVGLAGTAVVGERAESLIEDLGGRLDAVVARCAGEVSPTLRTAVRFLRPGGIAVVSGPPKETPLGLGEWVTVPGPGGSGARRFAVARG